MLVQKPSRKRATNQIQSWSKAEKVASAAETPSREATISRSPRIVCVSLPISSVDEASPSAKTEAFKPAMLEETPRLSRISAISG